MSEPAPLVCVVDDDAMVRKSLLRLFKAEGLEAEGFESAQDYLDRALPAGPSCLVLDVHMPELSGLDLQQVLADGGRDEQIVFITGQGDIPMCARAMRAGATDFLPKPFSDMELLTAVRRALERSRTRLRNHAEQAVARARIATLSPREHQVFERVITGMMNKEIAADFGTSIKTVKIQRAKLMAKMGVVSVAELVNLAQVAQRQ